MSGVSAQQLLSQAVPNNKVCARQVAAIGSGARAQLTCQQGTDPGRFVIIKKASGYLTLCEVEVYGEAAPAVGSY